MIDKIIAALVALSITYTLTLPGITAQRDTEGVAPPPTPTATATSTPAPTATPAPATYSGTLTSAQMDSLLTETGWPHYLHDRAKRVFKCESQWNTYAVGKAGERGIAQIHPIHGVHWQRAFDARYNLTYALYLFNGRGWAHWAYCSGIHR